jgi:hypothetical protein
MALSVRCVGFWEGFSAHEFFLPVLSLAAGEECVLVPSTEKADITLSSVFRNESRKATLRRLALKYLLGIESPERLADSVGERSALRVWFTGENVRPPLEGADVTLSFDRTEGNNFRVPLWWLLFPIEHETFRGPLPDVSRLGIEPKLSDALKGRPVTQAAPRKFAVGFFSNREPHRARLVEALAAVGQVDVYGSMSGRRVASKYPMASEYAFMVCPENDLYPGYVTEKAVEAWACGAIPLYFGLDRFGDLNPEALINADDFSSREKFVERVSTVWSDPALMADMRAKPILKSAPDISGLVGFLRTALKAKGLISEE